MLALLLVRNARKLLQFMHRDVKPENMLLCDNRRLLKLSDFGCAKMSSDDEHTMFVGSERYVAPEVRLSLDQSHFVLNALFAGA